MSEAHPLRVGAHELREEGLGVADRVAQAVHPLEPGALVGGPGEHRHRVAVAEQVGVRAYLVHVPRQVDHDGDGAQAAEDAADAEGVADRLAQPVPGGNVEVGAGGRVPADLHLVDHVVGARERGAAVPGRGHRGLRAPVCAEIRRTSRSACASRSALMS